MVERIGPIYVGDLKVKVTSLSHFVQGKRKHATNLTRPDGRYTFLWLTCELLLMMTCLI